MSMENAVLNGNKTSKEVGFADAGPVSMEKVERWFESLKTAIQHTSFNGTFFDVDNKFNTYRLHAIYAEEYKNARGKTEVRMTQDLDAFGSQYGTVRGLEFLTRAKCLNEFDEEDKERLYRMANQGRLSLHARDGNPSKEKPVFVKEDGTAGIADLTKIIRLNQKIKGKTGSEKDLLLLELRSLNRDVYAGAEDPQSWAEVFEKKFKAMQKLIKDAAKDPSVYAHLEQTVFQLYAAKDAGENPEFYVDDSGNLNRKRSAQRMEIMNKSVKDEVSMRFHVEVKYLTDPNHPEYALTDEEAGNTYYKHPIGEAIVMNALLHKIRDERRQQGLEDDYRKTMQDYLLDEDGNGYLYNMDYPWEVSEKIALDVRNGKSIYYKKTDHEGKTQFQRVVITKGGCGLVDITFPDEEELAAIRPLFERCLTELKRLGFNKNEETQEFRMMYAKLEEIMAYLNKTEGFVDNLTLKDKMQALFNDSSNYFIAKLTQPHNARRAGRFMISDALRIGTSEALSGTNLSELNQKVFKSMIREDMLASKAMTVEAMMEAMTNGVPFDNQYMDPNVFWEHVSAYKDSEIFDILQSEEIGAKATDSLDVIGEKLQKAKEKLDSASGGDEIDDLLIEELWGTN